MAIPSLLAVSAVERYLIRTKKCTAVSIVLESAEPRDVNHFATLLGYGARAVNPYLAHAAIGSLIDQGLLDKDYHTAVKDYNQAIPQRHREDRLQDGYLYHPVLPVCPDLRGSGH